jgi:hypothetical protein
MTSVEPRAATGRLTVNPGDQIVSTWGNTTFDQTMEVFDTAAQRDAQWATPHDGALAYTLDTQTAWLRRSGAWITVMPTPAAIIRARAYKGAAQGCTGSAFQIITFDTFDYGNTYFSGGVFTVPAGGAGDYLITAGVLYDAATTRANITIFINGAQRSLGPNNVLAGAAFESRAVNDVLACNAGDTIDIRSYVTASGGVNIGAGTQNTHVSIRRLPTQ